MQRRVRNNILALSGILLLVLIASWINFGGDRTENILGSAVELKTKQGLDLQGGYQILLQARDKNVSKDRMQAALDVISKRVGGLGTNEPLITLQGEDSRRISVELPGVTDEQKVRSLIGSTGRLEFIDAGSANLTDSQVVQTSYCTTGSLYQPRPNLCGNTATPTPGAGTPGATGTAGAAIGPVGTPDPNATPGATVTPDATATTPATDNKVYQTIITGAELDSSKVDVGFDQNTGAAKVLFGTKAAAASIFQNFTSSHLGQSMAIVLDGKIISSATIQGAIGTQGEITNPSAWSTAAGKAEVANIVLQLKYGALPVELDVISSRKVGATLGQDSIDKSYIAGAVGLGLVATFMLLYFRLPGLLADLALVIYALITFAIFKWFGVVLTLAGIAGFILSIGMAVDANVLIFARLKEELRLGRPIERGVEDGFRNAWPSIRDSNISTMITCAILYWFGGLTGTSVIQGFALTLFLGVICSLFTAITVTHTFLQTMFLLAGRRGTVVRHPWWYGVNRAFIAQRTTSNSTAGGD
ncbi:MAG: protein translocase subunit SecD [Chloroflexota bacterium]